MFESIDHELYAELAPIRGKLGINGEQFQNSSRNFTPAHGVDFLTD
jgi:hypothetical protein